MNEILNINNVHGYLDKKDGTAYLNAGDVARGFGFTKTETKNGVKYESVRWARVNEYLSSFGFRPNVGEDDFLPENMVYRLGFKASNEVAQKFQAVLADEVLPAIRRHGAYMTDQALERAITEPDFSDSLGYAAQRRTGKAETGGADVGKTKAGRYLCRVSQCQQDIHSHW